MSIQLDGAIRAVCLDERASILYGALRRLGDTNRSSGVKLMMLTSRLATPEDIPTLESLIRMSIDTLQQGFLNDEQIRASHAIMGIDTQLIDDQTYFVVEANGRIVGCGGWSRRATLYGGDHNRGRDSALLDPDKDAARVRAMYTHPDFARRGVGRLILSRCEAAARAEGFTSLELMATRSGQPLYTAVGFQAVEPIEETSTGTSIPLLKMTKPTALGPNLISPCPGSVAGVPKHYGRP